MIKMAFVGDVLLTRRLPNKYPPHLAEISRVLKGMDVSFGNLEMTVHRKEGYPEAFPGGSYVMSDPLCLEDLHEFGFNVFNTANNHSMDYGHGGLLATLRYLDEQGIPHCGTGKNLSDAALPAFVECTEGRVAFIGITSSFHDSYAAGPQNQDLQGRPGVNPLRHTAVYELEERYYNDLARIASVSGINSYHDQARKEGYLPQEVFFKFGTFNFKKGLTNKIETTPLEGDLRRTLDSIKDAKNYSDVIVVSIHSHQFKNNDKHNTPDFIRVFAQACIEAGGNIVVCHGPHVVRGVELFNGGVIFHGLGNFMLQHETMSVIPEEQYWKSGVTRQMSTGVGDAIFRRSKGGTIGLTADPDAWYSYIATVEYDNGQLNGTIQPIRIEKEKNNGLPCIVKNDQEILNKIESLSAIWGTIFNRTDGLLRW